MRPFHEHLPEKLAENIRFTWIRCLLPTLVICLPLAVMIGQLIWPYAYAKHSRKVTRFIVDMESRYPSPLPARPLSSADWEAYPPALDKYLSDYFPFRNSLVSLHSNLKYCLGIPPNSRIIIGKDDWLFYGVFNEADDIRGVSKIHPALLKGTREFLDELQKEMDRRGIIFLVVLAPNKSSIYPEMLPAAFYNPTGRQSLDDWLDAMKDREGRVAILDLRTMLRKKKAEEILYFKTDTHWNLIGGSLASEAVLKQLQSMGVPVRPVGLTMKNFVWEGSYNGDLARMGGLKLTETTPKSIHPGNSQKGKEDATLKEFFPESNTQASSFIAPSAGPLLLIHDSFGISMKPLLSEAFSPALYVTLGTTPTLPQILAAVDHYKPRVLLWERVERNPILAPQP